MKKRIINKKAKKLIKVAPIVIAPVENGRLQPLSEVLPEEVILDLQSLASSKGWKRLKQFLQEKVSKWDRELDLEEFPDMPAFNRRRDLRNAYKNVMTMPEQYIKALQKAPDDRNMDPYVQ